MGGSKRRNGKREEKREGGREWRRGERRGVCAYVKTGDNTTGNR